MDLFFLLRDQASILNLAGPSLLQAAFELVLELSSDLVLRQHKHNTHPQLSGAHCLI